MNIKILGSGCKKCVALADNAKAAAEIDAEIEKVTDFVDIAGYGVMSTPGLVIDDQVVSSGRVPSADEIQALMTND